MLKDSITDRDRMLCVDVSDLIDTSSNLQAILILEGNTSGNAVFTSKRISSYCTSS